MNLWKASTIVLAAALGITVSTGMIKTAGADEQPKMHQALGTFDAGGLVRMSVGWATTVEEIDEVLSVASAIAAA